jgi:hypothetical protein
MLNLPHGSGLQKRFKFCMGPSNDYSCSEVEFNQIIQIFFPVPIVSYAKTMPCGDSHLRFPMNTKTHIL